MKNPLIWSTRHRFKWSRITGRRLVIIVATAAVVGSISTTAIAVGGSRRTATSTATTISITPKASVAHWKVPHDQIGAPVVTSGGGAAYGQGGFNGVACPTASECVAVGADPSLDGVVSTTNDGGATWTQGATTLGSPALNAVACGNASSCVAGGNGAAAYSSDGGATWTSVSLPTSNTSLLSVSCTSSTNCVGAGVIPGQDGPLGGALLVTQDGGKTWKSAQTPTTVGAVGSVDCPSATFCVAVGSQILVSADGGATWAPRSVSGGTGVLRAVSCASTTSCVAIGPNPSVAQNSNAAAFEVASTDSGATWHRVTLPSSTATLDVIFCFRGGSCQADGSSLAGLPAPTLMSSNVGSSWSSVASLNSEISSVSAVSCGTASTCVFVGSNSSGAVAVSTAGSVVKPPASISGHVRAQKVKSR